MPGDWIKLEKTTLTKPEVYQLCDKLGKSRAEIVLALLTVWCWVDSECAECNAASVTESALNDVAGIPGFARAMVAVGWLEPLNPGYRIPNFERHLSKSAKRRGLTARRVHESRNADVTLPALPERYQSKSKNKNKKTPPTPLGGKSSSTGKSKTKTDHTAWQAVCELLPAESDLRCAEFQAAWSDWVQHRKEKKAPLTPQSVKTQIKQLDGMGLKRAVAMIRHTLFKGWQGLRESDESMPANKGDWYDELAAGAK